MSKTSIVRIGTRGSNLALAQAHETRRRLAAAHGWPEREEDQPVEIVVIKTTGDKITHKPLQDIGGKGLFTKEIEEALMRGDIDMAVHSMKDMPAEEPRGLVIPCILEREDPRDVFIGRVVNAISDLEHGAKVGSTSLRRKAQLLRARPDLIVVTFRGNVETRLEKLRNGEVEGTILARAGLNRLGMTDWMGPSIPPSVMLPAVGQGAVGLQIREDDHATRDLIAKIDHEPSRQRVTAERGFLAALDGSCHTPIAGLAEIQSADRIVLRGMILSPDGRHCYRVERTGRPTDAEQIGRAAGEEVKSASGGLERMMAGA